MKYTLMLAIKTIPMDLIKTPKNTLIWLWGTKEPRQRTKVEKQSTGIVVTNYWRVYNEIIPQEKLVQTRAETYTVENYNAIIRHILARFRRKTKYYPKSIEMMELSLKFLMAKRNKLISMQSY